MAGGLAGPSCNPGVPGVTRPGPGGPLLAGAAFWAGAPAGIDSPPCPDTARVLAPGSAPGVVAVGWPIAPPGTVPVAGREARVGSVGAFPPAPDPTPSLTLKAWPGAGLVVRPSWPPEVEPGEMLDSTGPLSPTLAMGKVSAMGADAGCVEVPAVADADADAWGDGAGATAAPPPGAGDAGRRAMVAS